MDESINYLNLPDYSKTIFNISISSKKRFINYLSFLYGFKIADKYYLELERLIKSHYAYKSDFLLKYENSIDHSELFSEKDIVLITYGDIIKGRYKKPLSCLYTFARKYLKDAFNTIHILPFFPYSSDRGFSIIDYEQVNPELGTWNDINNIRNGFKLMFDIVLNHISAESLWFQEFLNGHPYYKDFFIVFSTKAILADEQLKLITRPRTSELFTEFATINGTKLVWTTFSPDQIDLNYKNPDVLMKMVYILLYYIRRGASIIRLDAVTYLWETLGTNCAHLKQTHIIIKLFREIINIAAPYVLLITETNVPHEDNIKYFGNSSDEAHMVYNFALPPLVLYTYLKEDSQKLTNWAKEIKKISNKATYFNFLDSHDGIGLFPVKSILSEEDIRFLVLKTLERGGFISYRTNQDGFDVPYELNITWYSAVNDENENEDIHLQIKRFISTRAIALAFIGVPGIYIHSLLGSKNDAESVISEKQTRSINRKVLKENNLHSLLKDINSSAHRVLTSLIKIIKIRNSEKLFDPSSDQLILDISPKVFALIRFNNINNIICINNISKWAIDISVDKENIPFWSDVWIDIITNKTYTAEKNKLFLKALPYDVLWLKNS